MNRQELYAELEEILATYCEDCFLKAYHRKEFGKTNAHKFCIQKCTVGQKLKEYGKKLS
ncbi:zinc-finger domain-containing protein [Falsibacillus pallidus]|uniref:Uncharacterized protein DUF2602 n=1 Tax=Falsibacillus pallidus TaxID=493781 RepID=A0A370GIL5_9BACI|nr:zinc-finger domain-containing protein [Falsibacillus pallidus]RDI43056.1 uncharacterized protein DUF2602 [Falsibacillus pallidus]